MLGAPQVGFHHPLWLLRRSGKAMLSATALPLFLRQREGGK